MPLRFFIAVILFLSTGAVAVEGRVLTRGQQWVRNHPFTIMALTGLPASLDGHEYKEAGMTVFLPWRQNEVLLQLSDPAGLPWQMHIYPHKEGLTDEIKNKVQGFYQKYPRNTGWLIWDEPNRQAMPQVGKSLAWFRKTFPDTLVYSNALPGGAGNNIKYYGKKLPPQGYNYTKYVKDFADIIKPDVLMYDAYPFSEGGGTNDFFSIMNTIRSVALKRGLPYWTFIQSFQNPNLKRRMPSESDLRMHVFSHLTYGFTGIAYFTYGAMQGPAMITPEGERNPIYNDVQKLNAEVINLGETLRTLTSTDVRYVQEPGSTAAPNNVAQWTPDAGNINKNIQTIAIDNFEPADWKSILVGFFTDDVGGRYFMVTNLWHDKGATASDRELVITLKFRSKIKQIRRLSRETGSYERLPITKGTLKITLPGGTGDLFKF